MFPSTRFRRLRQSPMVRALVKETTLQASHLIMPFFVTHGRRIRNPIVSMPGQFQLSVDELINDVRAVERAGIPAVLLFGLPKKKDPLGREAYDPKGVVQQAVRAIKKEYPKLVVMTDLCFCEYTNHGHCGVIKKTSSTPWDVDNDATLRLLQKTAVVQATAGADFVAPSGMMDGAVAAIRQALDKQGFKNTGILAYSAKYASIFYGPFRDAAGSTPQFGNRQTYQMDPANSREALREIDQDIQEGADMVMVKPALSYLDVIARIKPSLKIPLVAYNVSGEYAMVKAAEKLNWIDGKNGPRAALEILTSIKRAGADLIITYHALDVAQALRMRA
jgi:porphobilinogen synthase